MIKQAPATPSAPGPPAEPATRRLAAGDRRTVGWWLRNLTPFAALVALVIAFGLMNEHFWSTANLTTLLRQSAILLIVACGSTFVILMASIDLSVGATVTLCATVSALWVPHIGLAVVPVAALVGLAVGAVNGVLFVVGRIPSFLVTLGMMSILAGISLIISNGTPIVIRDAKLIDLATGEGIPGVPNLFVWAVVVYGLTAFVGLRTRFGRYIYAIGGGERIANLAGVPVNRYKLYAFLVSGTLAGLGGVLLAARVGSAAAGLGDALTLQAIAAVVMGGTALTGGVGGVHRTLLGVAVIAVLSNGMNVVGIEPYTQTLIQGVVVIAAVAVAMDRRKVEVIK
jgi:ribose transport system permease protein